MWLTILHQCNTILNIYISFYEYVHKDVQCMYGTEQWNFRGKRVLWTHKSPNLTYHTSKVIVFVLLSTYHQMTTSLVFQQSSTSAISTLSIVFIPLLYPTQNLLNPGKMYSTLKFRSCWSIVYVQPGHRSIVLCSTWSIVLCSPWSIILCSPWSIILCLPQVYLNH